MVEAGQVYGSVSRLAGTISQESVERLEWYCVVREVNGDSVGYDYVVVKFNEATNNVQLEKNSTSVYVNKNDFERDYAEVMVSDEKNFYIGSLCRQTIAGPLKDQFVCKIGVIKGIIAGQGNRRVMDVWEFQLDDSGKFVFVAKHLSVHEEITDLELRWAELFVPEFWSAV